MAGVQYVLFSLHHQTYGVEISKIKEVLSYRKVTPLPNMKGFSRGIINLRGVIVPIFDLRDKFRLPEIPLTAFHVIIVMEISGRIMGIIADEISDVVELAPKSIQDTTNLPPGIQKEYFKGIGKHDEELVMLLDMDRILSQDELEALDST